MAGPTNVAFVAGVATTSVTHASGREFDSLDYRDPWSGGDSSEDLVDARYRRARRTTSNRRRTTPDAPAAFRVRTLIT
jgi:hypothetical protein